MALARRLRVVLAALLALAGLALTVLGAWFAVLLGPKGTAAFTVTSVQPAALLGPSVLNRANVPVTVTAHAASGPVFLGAAVPQDASDAVAQSRHEAAIALQFPARTITLEGFGGQPMPDPSGYHVWRSTGEDSLTVSQDQAPQSVLAYATKGGQVDLTVTYARTAWFLEALVALVVGLIVLAFAGGWLWQLVRTRQAGAVAGAAESSDVVPEAEAASALEAEPAVPQTPQVIEADEAEVIPVAPVPANEPAANERPADEPAADQPAGRTRP